MNKKGFTLTEILIVLVVAGILLALILPNTLKAIERANVTSYNSNLNTIQVALFMCFTQERVWDNCDTFAELTADNYLSDTPPDPFGGGYVINDDPNGIVGKVACGDGSGDYPDDVNGTECAVK